MAHPLPPWPAKAAHNSKRTGWAAFFEGRARVTNARSRFPAQTC